MVFPNFFITKSTGLEWFSVFLTIHPVVVIVVGLRAISINAHSLEREGYTSLHKELKKDLNASNYTEMSDYSSLSASQDNIAGVKFRKIKDDAKDETHTIIEKE